MIRWMSIVRPEDRISEEELRTRLKVKNMGESVQDRRLRYFGYLERMENSAWSSNCGILKVSGSFPRERPRKTWNEVIICDLKERKVRKDKSKDRNAWRSFTRNRPTHANTVIRR